MNNHDLRQHLDQAMPDLTPSENDFSKIEEATAKRIQKQKKLKKLYRYGAVAAAALVLTVSAVTAGMLNLPRNTQTDTPKINIPEIIENFDSVAFNVNADKESKGGIAVDSGFTITSDKDVSAEDLKKYIKLTPQTDFTLKKQGTGKFYLSAGTMESGKLINIALVDEKGRILKNSAFQTEQEFKVESCYPKNKNQYTDLHTGIEIKFTYPDVETAEFEKFFTISPAVEGAFIKNGPTIFFIPNQSLDSNKWYTVTLKAGLTSPTGGTLKADFTSTFQTIYDRNAYGITGKATETFLPDDKPLVEVYAQAGCLAGEYSASVYRFSDAAGYTKTLRDYVLSQTINSNGRTNDIMNDIPTSGLATYLTYKSKFANIRSQTGGSDFGYAILPDTLPEGWYLIKLSTTAPNGTLIAVQKLIQVSSLSVYSLSSNTDVCFWIHDTKTGKQISDAAISLPDYDMSGKTGVDGILKIKKSSAASKLTDDGSNNFNFIMTLKSGERQFVDINTFYNNYDNERTQIQNLFYTALYTDRAAYLPKDTIRVWGVIQARDGKTPVPSGLSVKFNDIRNPITVDKDGSFTTQIKIEDYLSGGSIVSLCKDDIEICNKYISILAYTKPSYIIESSTDSWFYTDPAAPVKVHVNASFYDGSPVDSLGISASFEGSEYAVSGFSGNLDNNGETNFEMKYTDTQSSWHPSYATVNIKSNENENTYGFSSNKPILFFYRDIMLETKNTIDGKKPILNITTSKIDTSRLSQDNPMVWSVDTIRGPSVDVDITITATRTWYEKVETGSYYDEVRKHSVPQYQYQQRQAVPITVNVKTSCGKLVYDKLPALLGNDFYQISYSYKDSKGQSVLEQDYVRANVYQESGKGKTFTFSDDYYVSKKLQDEPMQLKLKENGITSVSNGKDEILTIISKNDIVSTAVSPGTAVTVNNDESMIPNCLISGAYFDGSHVYAVENYKWRYDYSERQLDIQIKTDKVTYNTKEKAKITVTATMGGKPVKNATLLVSVVDEAALAVENNNFDLLKTLYQQIYNINAYSYASYVYHDMEKVQTYDGGGEGGEGDSEGVRKDFTDTAFFATVKTDANGNATAEITLPDNLTEWRITSMGYDELMNAGQNQASIKVSRDFFVNPIISSQFIQGDDVVFSVRSYGEKAQDNNVDYIITLKGDKKGEKKINGKAKSNTVVSFGKLPIGNYTVTILGKLGSDSDGVELPFTVKESGTEIMQTTTSTLDAIDISPTRYPVTLSFYNGDYDLFNKLLDKLVSCPPLRADEKVASAFGQDMIAQMTGVENPDSEKVRAEFANDSAFTPYQASYTDIQLTARIAAGAPQYFSTPMITFFYNIINSINNDNNNQYSNQYTREQIAAAYMGLAALKQPVLNDLRYLMTLDSLSDLERLYIIAGLALIGDTDGAKEAYHTYISPHITSYFDSSSHNNFSYYINEGGTPYQKTALSLITASVVNSSNAEGLARTLLANNGNTDLYYCEFMLYLTYFRAANTDSVAEFSYYKDGKTETITLNNRAPHTVTFDRDSFIHKDLKKITGNVMVSAYYYGKPVQTGNSGGMALEKLVVPSGGGDITTGKLILITLSPQNTSNGAQINDYLPTGFRFLYMETDKDDHNYLINQEGQKLTFSYTSGIIRYYARAVLPGEFTVDSAYMTDFNSQMTSTPKSTIVVKEK